MSNNIETAMRRIINEQKESGMELGDFWIALSMIARCHGLLRAALKLAPNYTIGAPNPLPDGKLMEQLTEPLKT